ncbi:MAG: DNA primase [Phycisphaeraceae bacterium]|nr:DNA primase [Phycisphaeraceae bacterium]
MNPVDDPKRLVQQATDLVALIGEHIALKAKGREMVGLCPFHDDHSPSMQVSPAKQIYKCFSCGAGGDAFSFVMNYHKMTFPEALKYLAERAGIKLSDYRPAGGGFGVASGGASGGVDRQKLAEVNERAMKFYRSMLEHPEFGREARAYVAKRGISDEMAEAFGLGYAPDRWDALAVKAAERGLAMGDMQAAGLVQPRQQGGGHYDRFRHRLMFPILDSLGRAIAFGGRKMREEDEPKYLNSPETPLFNKSATLYGLHRAKKPIIDAKTAVIVEGYTDVIACHQAGVCNVVATLGTALTREHLRELRRFAEKVVLIFDADAAGQKAADRAVEIFLGQEIDVAVAVLPTGPGGAKMDPAELFGLAEGRELWRKAMEEAVDALTYQFERFRQQFQGAETLTGRQKLAEGYLQNLARLGWSGITPIRRGMIVQLVAKLLGMGEQDVAGALTRYAAAQPRAMAYGAPGETSGGAGASGGAQHNMISDIDRPLDERTIRRLQTAERQMIGCLLRQPELFHAPLWDGRALDEALTPGDMVTSAGRQLYQTLYDLLADGAQPSLAEFLADLASVGRQELANLATQGESEVEQLMQQSQTELASLLGELARVILSHHQQEAYDRKRSGLLPPGSPGPGTPGSGVPANAGVPADGADQTKLAHELLEHQRNNPSPLRHPWRRRLNTPPTT